MSKTTEIKLGDMLWVSLKGADQNYGFGEVVNLWRDEETKIDYFDFYCLVNGGLRSGQVSNVIEKPGARMVGKMSQTQKEVRELLRNKR
jgi:hypothetical protein|tara:strand:- start:159 stop:425 length:267 start_codon:yes stop_codon:yes gene_type:complete